MWSFLQRYVVLVEKFLCLALDIVIGVKICMMLALCSSCIVKMNSFLLLRSMFPLLESSVWSGKFCRTSEVSSHVQRFDLFVRFLVLLVPESVKSAYYFPSRLLLKFVHFSYSGISVT